MEISFILCFRQGRIIYDLNIDIKVINRGCFLEGSSNTMPSFLLPVACLIQVKGKNKVVVVHMVVLRHYRL